MREAIYKGTTRPAMKWGVPLLALVGVFMPAIVIAVWCAVIVSLSAAAFAAVALVALFVWIRALTRRDDQRLHQALLWAQLQHASRNRALWRARSYSPLLGRRRLHVR